MHLPKHSNPHLIVDTTRIVSRRILQLEDDADAERGGEVDETGLEKQEMDDLRVKLDKFVSKRLKLKRAPISPEDESHPRKRHKILTEGKPVEPQQHSEPVSFRLVSRSLPPRTIHLTSKPPKTIPVKEPPCEDTEQELKERIYRSALCAVDLGQIEHTFSTADEQPETAKSARSAFAIASHNLSASAPRDPPGRTPSSAVDKSAFKRPSKTFTPRVP